MTNELKTTMEVGDEVYIAYDIYEEASEDLPGGLLASPGDKVVIVNKTPCREFAYQVRHPHVKEGGFLVKRTELMWRAPFNH